MSNLFDELAGLIRDAGGTLRLYGKPITVDALRKHAAATGARRTPGKLPIPRLSATVYEPLNNGTGGRVVVHEAAQPRRDGDPRPPVERHAREQPQVPPEEGRLMPAQDRIQPVKAYRPVAWRVLQQIEIDAKAGHIVDLERVWPADPNAPAYHRFVCTCGRVGPPAASRRRAVAGGNYHRRITRARSR